MGARHPTSWSLRKLDQSLNRSVSGGIIIFQLFKYTAAPHLSYRFDQPSAQIAGKREGQKESRLVRNPDFIYKQVHNPDVTNPDLADVRVTHLFVSP